MATTRALGLLRGSRATLKHLQPIIEFSRNRRSKSTASVIETEAKPSVVKPQRAPQLPPHALLPNKMLLRSLLVSTVSSHSWLLTPALKILQLLVHPKISLLDVDKNPLLRTLIKRTLYNHFCAGENELEVRSTIDNIKNMGFKGVILTYAREIVVDATNSAAKSTTSVQTKPKGGITKGSEYRRLEGRRP